MRSPDDTLLLLLHPLFNPAKRDLRPARSLRKLTVVCQRRYWSEETSNEPPVKISWKTRTGEPLVVGTAVAPGPPLWTTNSKGTPLGYFPRSPFRRWDGHRQRHLRGH